MRPPSWGFDENYGPLFFGVCIIVYIPYSLGDQKGPIILINPHFSDFTGLLRFFAGFLRRLGELRSRTFVVPSSGVTTISGLGFGLRERDLTAKQSVFSAAKRRAGNVPQFATSCGSQLHIETHACAAAW